MKSNSRDPVVSEYSALAREYDKKWSFYVEATTRETLARLHLLPTDRVLDIGCGTGELLAKIGARYPSAVLAGLDPVPEMLQVAREKLPEAIDLRHGWANELPWEDSSFDVVVSANMFHQLVVFARTSKTSYPCGVNEHPDAAASELRTTTKVSLTQAVAISRLVFDMTSCAAIAFVA